MLIKRIRYREGTDKNGFVNIYFVLLVADLNVF
jgi:hypothetical protein